jgi:hypothetical protein
MTRTRASAKTAGATFERQVADYLAAEVDDRIDRRVKTGAKDKGDIGGIRLRGHRVVVECKNTVRTDLAGWIAEAQIQADNDGAPLGVICHKRKGIGKAGGQWVTMTLGDFAWLIKEANA